MSLSNVFVHVVVSLFEFIFVLVFALMCRVMSCCVVLCCVVLCCVVFVVHARARPGPGGAVRGRVRVPAAGGAELRCGGALGGRLRRPLHALPRQLLRGGGAR
jgi:hypothetical protein